MSPIRCGDRVWRPLSLALALFPLFRDWGPARGEPGDLEDIPAYELEDDDE